MEKRTRQSAKEPLYEVVWPLGRTARGAATSSHPVADLRGKTVCELWDWFFKGDEMFPIIRQELRRRYPGINFVDYTVFGNTHGRNEREVIAALPDLLRKHKCDVVISGVGQ